MTTDWVVPLLVSVAVGLVATPVARKIALASGFVDRPSRRKSHKRVTPYMGGVAIALAVLAGEQAGRGTALDSFLIACGFVLVAVGLMDDRRSVDPHLRVVVEVILALFLLSAGVRLAGTGWTVVSIVAALVLLVVVTNSSNLLDNLDGLCAGVTAAAAGGLLATAISLGDQATIVLSASLLGACLAFLVFNAKPASIFMGDAGSLFLGFVLTVTCLWDASLLSGPNRLVFPLLFLGLPLADTATVVMARLKNGRPVMAGGRDHLSHRLAKRGLGSSRAVALLVAVEAVMVTLAALEARREIPWPIALGGGAALLLCIVAVAGRVRVYRRSRAEYAASRAEGSHSRSSETRAARTVSRRQRWAAGLTTAAAVVLLALCALASYALVRGAQVGDRGEQALLDALNEAHAGAGALQLSKGTLVSVAHQLSIAENDFSTMRGDLDRGGPMMYLGRFVPLAGVQVQATSSLANAGVDLSSGTLELVDAVERVAFPANSSVQLDQALPDATYLQSVMQSGAGSLAAAVNDVALLDGDRLLGPLGRARARLAAKLPHVEERALASYRGLNALVGFLGGNGPSSWLFLSQNPDEVRPTGGFIGTYGVIQASDGHVSLGPISPIEDWNSTNPDAVVPLASSPTVLQVADSVQNLSDVNAGPDWSTDAKLALRLWQEGGGAPVNGVVSMTPEFLAQLLGVLGPVPLPSYGKVLTSTTLVPDLESYAPFSTTTSLEADTFGAAASQVVLHALLSAPASEWSQLVQAVITGFESGEAMAYSTDPSVEGPLQDYGWNNAMPSSSGDFFADSEFEFIEENGSALHRVFDHTVVVHPNGSATATTTMTIEDTAPPSPVNTGSYGYIVAYGPVGASAGRGTEASFYAYEPPVEGHPAVDWLTGANPLGQMTLTSVWNFPDGLQPLGNGIWSYQLEWRPQPSHSGDVLDLHVELPRGWKWVGDGPPSEITLNGVYKGDWEVKKNNS